MSKQETPLDFMLGMTHEEFEHWVWCGEHSDDNVVDLHKEALRLRKELEEARKIRFPRQADGEGGWTIDYDFLDELETRAYKGSDYSMDLEDLETVLLALEKVLGQEGEGNQRTIEVTLTNAGYKPHQINWDNED